MDKLVINFIDDIGIYSYDEILFNQGITTLIGRNGSGKTTLLRHVRDFCREHKIPCFSYSNFDEGGANAQKQNLYSGNIDMFAGAMLNSEGMNISMNFACKAREIGGAIRKAIDEGASKFVLLLDALDSGASINVIREMKSFFKVIEKDNNDKLQVYIINASNSYEFAKGQRCIDVIDGEEINFKSYEDYSKFICKARRSKNERSNS